MLRVKKVIIHSLINRKSRHRRYPAPGADAGKVLFLFAVRDSSELTYYQNSIKTIEKYDIPYDVLVFTTDELLKKIPVHHINHDTIVPKNITFWELPNNEVEAKLKRHAYKAVVNTYNGFVPVLDYAAAIIPSSARVSRFRVTNMPFYNMRIDFAENGSEQDFLEHTIEYLKKVK